MPGLRLLRADAGDGPRRPVHRRSIQVARGIRDARAQAPAATRALRSRRGSRCLRPAADASHGARIGPLQLVLVPQRHQPLHDREPARDRTGSCCGRGWAPAGRARDRPGCNDGTLLDGYGDFPPGVTLLDGSVGRHALRGGQGLRRDHRLLQSRGARSLGSRAEGKDHYEHRDVLRPRAPDRVRLAISPSRSRRRRHLGQRVLVYADDARQVELRHHLP